MKRQFLLLLKIMMVIFMVANVSFAVDVGEKGKVSTTTNANEVMFSESPSIIGTTTTLNNAMMLTTQENGAVEVNTNVTVLTVNMLPSMNSSENFFTVCNSAPLVGAKETVCFVSMNNGSNGVNITVAVANGMTMAQEDVGVAVVNDASIEVRTNGGNSLSVNCGVEGLLPVWTMVVANINIENLANVTNNHTINMTINMNMNASEQLIAYKSTPLVGADETVCFVANYTAPKIPIEHIWLCWG